MTQGIVSATDIPELSCDLYSSMIKDIDIIHIHDGNIRDVITHYPYCSGGRQELISCLNDG